MHTNCTANNVADIETFNISIYSALVVTNFFAILSAKHSA
jgi:hypothetical protein